MARAFQYRPKFVDIRIRPPKAAEEEAREEDVTALKPGERACDHPGCRLAATARAPKSRDLLNDYYWFCQPHAAEYNKGWNFWAGMSEGEIRARQAQEQFTGGRPTWNFKAGAGSRESAAFAQRFKRGQGGFGDPMNLFRQDQARAAARDDAAAFERRLGKIERGALADMDLDASADAPTIRARYTELLKRLHPDANGGDRSTEAKLQQVIKAYKALRKAGMA